MKDEGPSSFLLSLPHVSNPLSSKLTFLSLLVTLSYGNDQISIKKPIFIYFFINIFALVSLLLIIIDVKEMTLKKCLLGANLGFLTLSLF